MVLLYHFYHRNLFISSIRCSLIAFFLIVSGLLLIMISRCILFCLNILLYVLLILDDVYVLFLKHCSIFIFIFLVISIVLVRHLDNQFLIELSSLSSPYFFLKISDQFQYYSYYHYISSIYIQLWYLNPSFYSISSFWWMEIYPVWHYDLELFYSIVLDYPIFY